MVNKLHVGVTMKRGAKVALRKATLTTMAVLFFLTLLPGCAVVGPLLSLGSIGFAPLQYASTAITVGEFSYEYAANDKDPGEVIQAKIDNVLSGKAFELPEFMQEDGLDGTEEVMVAEADTNSVEAALSAQARRKRIEQILGRRTAQFERLELRRMAFLKAQANGELSLRQTAMVTSPDLFQGAVDETTLR